MLILLDILEAIFYSMHMDLLAGVLANAIRTLFHARPASKQLQPPFSHPSLSFSLSLSLHSSTILQVTLFLSFFFERFLIRIALPPLFVFTNTFINHSDHQLLQEWMNSARTLSTRLTNRALMSRLSGLVARSSMTVSPLHAISWISACMLCPLLCAASLIHGFLINILQA